MRHPMTANRDMRDRAKDRGSARPMTTAALREQQKAAREDQCFRPATA